MNCKDCLHYEICEAYSPRDSYATLHCAEECVCFTDRSEWIHLPCEVGDRIWYIRDGRVVFGSVTKLNIYSIATSGKLGKTAFLTREKAEKALEGTKGVNESDK